MWSAKSGLRSDSKRPRRGKTNCVSNENRKSAGGSRSLKYGYRRNSKNRLSVKDARNNVRLPDRGTNTDTIRQLKIKLRSSKNLIGQSLAFTVELMKYHSI